MIALKAPRPFREIINTEKNAAKNGLLKNTLISAGILGVCSLIGLVFHLFGLSEANIMSIYILGILVISALASEMIFGVISSVAGMLLFNCLYAEPTFTLLYYDVQYTITAIIMLIASLLTSYIMTLFKHYLEAEKQATRRSNILLEASQALQQAKNTEEIFTTAMLQLQRLFSQTTLHIPVVNGKLQISAVNYYSGSQCQQPSDWNLDKASLEHFIMPDSNVESPLTLIRNANKEIFFKIQVNGEIYALAGIIINADDSLTDFELNLVSAMMEEVALVLEKYRLQEFNERIAHEAEMERLRANLLRTISHDLRTPLTSISGSADILLNNEGQLEPDVKRQMYQNIYDDAEWLISLVENLLFTTRMENGAMSITTEPELLQDVILEALNRLKNRFQKHSVSINVPNALLMAHIDARLIIQVVANLIGNAIKYTPPKSQITVSAFNQDEWAVIEVADNGTGISDNDKGKIFDMFYTANNEFGDGRRGIGLGLSLCRAIVKAHGGSIYIRDNYPCGTVIGVKLRSEEICLESFDTGN